MTLKTILLPLLALALCAQTSLPADLYAPGRALVADIGRIVSAERRAGKLRSDAGRCAPMGECPRRRPRQSDPDASFTAVRAPPKCHIAWSFQRAWEDYFTVVQWDQRGGRQVVSAQ